MNSKEGSRLLYDFEGKLGNPLEVAAIVQEITGYTATQVIGNIPQQLGSFQFERSETPTTEMIKKIRARVKNAKFTLLPPKLKKAAVDPNPFKPAFDLESCLDF